MNLACVNIRSLLSCFTEFCEYVLEKDFDMVLVTESWLRDDFAANACSIPNYTFHHQSRYHKRGGGVGIYIKKKFKSSKFDVESCEALEQLWIDVTIGKVKYCVGVVYRPPATNVSLFLFAGGYAGHSDSSM